MRHVLVGSGPAGVTAATTLRRLAPRDEVVIVAEEAQPFYSKVLTSYFVAGKLPHERMLLSSSDQLNEVGIEVLAGRKAVRIDSSAQEVTLSGGEKLRYDSLLLAVGASPALPPVDGGKLPGVFTLWSHDDAVGISQWIRDGQKAVVIGAGLVGLKAAEGLMMRGLSVTAVELLDRVMPQLLAADDAALVRKALEQRGLAVRTGTGVVQTAGDARVRQVVLTDGTVLNCDLVVMATGVRPNLTLAKSAGAAIGRGIVVDQFMRTTVPGIYAAGDVAEGWDLVQGTRLPTPTWGNASAQGRIAAYNMAGQRKPFEGAVSINTFTFLGFSMAAVGITQPEGDYCQVETYMNPRTADYRKLLTLGYRLVGAIAMGDIRMVGIWRGLIARRSEDSAIAGSLLPHRTNFASAHHLCLSRC